MRSEKGITILEIMLSLVIIGITSSIIMLSIKNYQQCVSDEVKTKEYYEECAKLYAILLSSNDDKFASKELKYANNRYEVYSNNELITYFENNLARNYQFDMDYQFNYISDIKLVIEGNYLFARFKGYLEENSLMVRW